MLRSLQTQALLNVSMLRPRKRARNRHDAAMFPRRQPQSDGGSPAHLPGLWEETMASHLRLSDQG